MVFVMHLECQVPSASYLLLQGTVRDKVMISHQCHGYHPLKPDHYEGEESTILFGSQVTKEDDSQLGA